MAFSFSLLDYGDNRGAKYGKHLSKEEAENNSANAVAVPPPSSSHANLGLPNAVHGNKTRYVGHR